MKKIFLIILVFCLSGCATFGPWIETKEERYKDKARGFCADLPKGWMRSNFVQYFMITRDGVLLENISVERLKTDKKLEFTKKTLFKNMNIQDLTEIEIDNFCANENIKKFEILSNKLLLLSGQEAFRLEYTYLTANNLKIQGIHYGFIYKDWVYRIHYEAAAQHYFNKHLGDFNNFIKTFQILEGNSDFRQGEESFEVVEIRKEKPAEDKGIESKTTSYSEYYRLLYKTISQAVVKPHGAGSGTVNAEFTLMSDGSLEEVRILEGSSEDPALRDAVETAIRNSAPFPPFPDDIKEDKKAFTITIEFRQNR